MDREIVAEKLESLRRCIQRVSDKCPSTVEPLLHDFDLQDILVLNLSRAVQLCVDIAAHLIADLEVTPPETMGSAFEALATAGVLDDTLATRLKKAVGFRNIAIHNYEVIDWRIVHAISMNQLGDFSEFAGVIGSRLDQNPS
jgi:uncharacterized protein YutE (UPF0331/DUF86 family)